MKRQTPRSFQFSTRPRAGAFMVVAMICLLLVSTVLGTLLKLSSIGRTQAKIEAYALQADWLAESGVERAAAKLAADADYKGETWDVAAEDLAGNHAGRVEIEVKPSGSGNRSVQVTASYPIDQTPSVTRSKTILVSVGMPDAKTPEQKQSPAAAEKRSR